MQKEFRNNYYEVLELPTNAPQHEVTRAYERAKLTYGTDNVAIYTIFSESEARELVSMIEEAYSILSNKVLRTIYDQRLLSGRSSLNELTYEAIVEASKKIAPEQKAIEKKQEYKKDPQFEELILSNSDWDGSFIKRVREYKNISLAKMNEVTKINSYYITAVENMDTNNLPATVFIRGYVLQIAKALQLDEKKVADSYMKILKEKPKSL